MRYVAHDRCEQLLQRIEHEGHDLVCQRTCGRERAQEQGHEQVQQEQHYREPEDSQSQLRKLRKRVPRQEHRVLHVEPVPLLAPIVDPGLQGFVRLLNPVQQDSENGYVQQRYQDSDQDAR